jgi:ArsR family transcriptional regulator, virulence genes transcriptional regulator
MLTLTKKNLAKFEANAGRAAEMLKALSNERRLMVLCQLGAGELSVGALQERLELSQSALSQHLSLLREEGIVATRREGQTIFYRVANPAAVKIIETLASIYCPEI